MLDNERHLTEDVLKKAFESGYIHATSSLVQLTKYKASCSFFHIGFHELSDGDFTEKNSLFHSKSNRLITTDIFGDITGKSYLFLSDEEYDLLTHTVPDGGNTGTDLKEEFAKEANNILSASVITGISNELKLSMFGDVPIFIGKVTGKIEDIIYDDFSEQSDEVYINAVLFTFEGYPTVTPCFIWVVDVRQ